jgi:hypothetical protein
MADKSKKSITPSRESVTSDYCGKDFEKGHFKGHTEINWTICPIVNIGFVQSKSSAGLFVYKCTEAGLNSLITVPSKVCAP